MVCPVYIEHFSTVLQAPEGNVTGGKDNATSKTLGQVAGAALDPGGGVHERTAPSWSGVQRTRPLQAP
jgi:hypothetical protein